jgi:hypothetical protein
MKTEFTFSDNLTAPGDDGLRRLVDEALNVLLERQKAPSAAGSPTTRTSAVRPTTPAPSAAQPAPVTDASSDGTAAPGDGAESSGSSLNTTLGWTGVAVGGALIGAGIFSVLRVSSIENEDKVDHYRRGFPPEVDSCERAEAGVTSKIPGAATPGEMQDFCRSASTFQALEFVFFGLGAISAGAGIYLLATDSSTSATRSRSYFAVTPPIGRSSGRVEFGFRF